MKTFMNTRRRAVLLVLVGLAAFPLSGCSYNKFVSQEEAVKAQWAQVQNQLQRRNDLITNLVETVKGYAQHEESVYKDIADSRSKLLAAKSPEETIQAANQHTSALGRLLGQFQLRLRQLDLRDVIEGHEDFSVDYSRSMDLLAGDHQHTLAKSWQLHHQLEALLAADAVLQPFEKLAHRMGVE